VIAANNDRATAAVSIRYSPMKHHSFVAFFALICVGGALFADDKPVSVPATPADKQAPQVPPVADKLVPFDPLNLTPAYKALAHMDEAMLSPFRKPEVRALQAANLERKSGPDVRAVVAKFHELHLTGVIQGGALQSKGSHPGIIVLGGWVFHEGQELVSLDSTTHKSTPIVPDHTVMLRSVTPQAIGLEVTRFGETSPVSVPIGLLEFLER
jgi:hypothetical protein